MNKPLLAISVASAVFAGVVAFHPGVAFATSRLSALPPSALTKPGTYNVDPAHTSLGFDIGHLGLSRVQGRFNKTSGTLNVDPTDLTKSSVSVTSLVDSIDTAVAPRDAHLKTADFFDAAKFPELTFKSTSIKKQGKGYVATGDLTMKGVTKTVKIPFKVYGPVQDPWGMTRIGVVADPISLDRTAYGINYDPKAVSKDVTVRLSLEATLSK